LNSFNFNTEEGKIFPSSINNIEEKTIKGENNA